MTGLNIKKNHLWGLLDDGSKLAILELLLNEGFKGDVVITGVIKGNTTVMKCEGKDKEIELPIDILTILNN